MKTFGDTIYDARMASKKLLHEVARKIGISAMYLSELETGIKLPKKGKVISMLSQEYNIPLKILEDLVKSDRKKQAFEAMKMSKKQKDYDCTLELSLLAIKQIAEFAGFEVNEDSLVSIYDDIDMTDNVTLYYSKKGFKFDDGNTYRLMIRDEITGYDEAVPIGEKMK